MSAKYRIPVPFFHFWPKVTHPAARSLCDSWASCFKGYQKNKTTIKTRFIDQAFGKWHLLSLQNLRTSDEAFAKQSKDNVTQWAITTVLVHCLDSHLRSRQSSGPWLYCLVQFEFFAFFCIHVLVHFGSLKNKGFSSVQVQFDPHLKSYAYHRKHIDSCSALRDDCCNSCQSNLYIS